MMRFYYDREQLRGVRTVEDLAAFLPKMQGYVETRDRDAAHLFGLMDLGKDDIVDGHALDPAVVEERLGRAARMIQRGQGAEFSRSPVPGDGTDRGLYGIELACTIKALRMVAAQALRQKGLVYLMNFSSKLLAR